MVKLHRATEELPIAWLCSSCELGKTIKKENIVTSVRLCKRNVPTQTALNKMLIRLPLHSSTDQLLCEKIILVREILYLQKAILSSNLIFLVSYRLTIDRGLLALEKGKA